jgi:hypothetical protein
MVCLISGKYGLKIAFRANYHGYNSCIDDESVLGLKLDTDERF